MAMVRYDHDQQVPSHCCVSSARLFTDRIKTIITNLKNTGEERREREGPHKEPADTAPGYNLQDLSLIYLSGTHLAGPNIRPDTTL